jgi:hypothetical protein
MILHMAFTFSGVILRLACRCTGLRLLVQRQLQAFLWPIALTSQALVAIVLKAMRRFRGPALFRGPRPSSSLGAPFWPLGLTVRRSRPLRGA